jgi:hypothetical protein
MFYSVPPSEATPQPFAELRVFIFTDIKPTKEEIILAKRGMRVILEKLMIIFPVLIELLEHIEPKWKEIDYDERQDIDLIRGKLITEIHGFEVEEIDIDEVNRWFKERQKELLLHQPYRYVRFYKKGGTIKREYDEWEIRERERAMEVEIYRKTGERIVKTFAEIVELVRKLEESRKLYEKLIEELEKI